MTDTAENPFWQYSLKLYARDGVEPLCLRLQNHYSANVNLLLWAVWLAEQQVRLDSARLQQAQALIAPYQDRYVEPLREMRNQLTSSSQQCLRKKILAAELEAEKAVQDELYQCYISERWSEDLSREALLSENMMCVLAFYNASAELPQSLATLS